jgi:pyruvate kinase
MPICIANSFGLKSALDLKIIEPGSTVITVQGWKQGSFHTNTMRILTVPVDQADLTITPLTSN